MAEAEKKKKQQGGHLAKRPAATTQHGHYADPLSPIASTPLKRQRINSAESSKASSSNHRAQGETRGTPAKSKQGGKFLSPRKLVKDFDANDGQSPNASTPNGTNAKSGEETPSASDDENANAEMFSPALKPPRSSRSPSSSPARSRTVVEATVVSSSSSSSEKSEASTTVSTTVEEEIVSEEATDEQAEQEFNPFYFMKTLPKYEDVAHGARPVALPERSRSSPKICLVLDLDETLVHCSVDDVDKPHLQFPVNFNGVDYTVNVKKRPHMEYFLRRVSKLFEVVVFTASHKAYAEKLLNLLDPHRNLIKYRLFREDCLDVYGNYLKDLNVLGRDLSKVLLVDNSPHAFGYQVSNGIPIETWYDDESDDELLNLLPFLESLVDADDVRPVIEKQFQIQKLIDATPDEIL